MSKKNPRLKFTDAELSPRLKEHVRRAGKAADKADKAQAKLPQKAAKKKRYIYDVSTGTVTNRLLFDENRKKAPSKLNFGEKKAAADTSTKTAKATETAKTAASSAAVPKSGTASKAAQTAPGVESPATPKGTVGRALAGAPVNALVEIIHQEITENEDENVGVESVHKLEETAETGVRITAHSARARKLKAHRTAEKAEKRLERANVNVLYQKYLEDHPQFSSNPLSRWQQKQAIRKQYAAAVRAKQTASTTAKTAEKSAKAAAKAAKAAEEEAVRAVGFVWRHKTGFGIIAALFVMLAFLLNCVSSCSIMLEGGLSVLSGTTFPSQDADMLGAEIAYAQKEADLQSYLDTYESTHSYDEYVYNLDEIGHDPYVLISLLTAIHGGEWTLAEVQGTLDMIFTRQYTLTEDVTVETRYDADGSPYQWTVCTVTLDNFEMDRLPVHLLDESGMNIYAAMMSNLGNRPDLFPAGEYPHASQHQDYQDYDIPPEALEDATFAAMITEAEKYLGYPYVWGGSSPSTSFDCSGFVSWVINHSGWNVGRLGVLGLQSICTPVSLADAKPGDLIFFENTYDAPLPGPTHVGIYVGDNTMIHCGNPISYTLYSIGSAIYYQ